MQYKVKLQGVSKQYTLYRNNTEKLLDIIIPNSLKKEKERNFFALRDITLEIQDGETIGIVGINGSGKSTISNILSSVIPPTSGNVDINGEPSLIAINVGLNNNLSGYDNIELKLLMHGFSRSEIKQMTPSIEEFAELGDFMDQPVKKYSSGMKSRLGFAISVHTNPDLLIVDEALSVGDKTFYQKCLDKINEFKERGKTIIFISHSIGQIKSISDRVLWLHNGEIKEFGNTVEVLNQYEEYINWFNKLTNEDKQKHKEELKQKRSMSAGMLHVEEKEKDFGLKTNNIPSRVNKKKEFKKTDRIGFTFIVQLTLFILAFTISAIFLIMPNTPTVVLGDNPEENEVIVEERPIIKDVEFEQEKVGIISVAEAPIYQDKELTSEADVLLFASEVSIIGENIESNTFIVNENNNNQYIKKDFVQVDYIEIEKSNITFDDIVEILPANFGDFYQYFLMQLGDSYENISENLSGADEVVELDNEGNTYVSYPFESLTIKYDDKETAVALIVGDIEPLTNLSLEEDQEKIELYTTENYRIVYNSELEVIGFLTN
ncbi:teichoic acids export ABC transporter ATP-binding subunit TagH [Alkalihalobacillus sp. FSL R5-0424]